VLMVRPIDFLKDVRQGCLAEGAGAKKLHRQAT
jgi:hypothetical protein